MFSVLPDPAHEDVTDDPTHTTRWDKDAIGQLVADRYRVRSRIAKGGMGEVLLAEHVDLRRLVALKVMAPPDVGGVDFEQRFRTEALALARLSHRNIVMVHDFGLLDDGRAYLAMEYVEGPRLTDEVAKGPLSVARTLDIAMQLAHALRYAHRNGMVHRDLTPSNLLLSTDADGREVLKIVDFGIVKTDRTDAEDTQDGVVMGSPHCMAPEQIDGVGVDARTDLYAVGVLLFRMLTGQYPFRGKHTMAVLMAHLDAPVPAMSEVIDTRHIPTALEQIVRRCLNKRQDRRFADADALLMALRRVAQPDADEASLISAAHAVPVVASTPAAPVAAPRISEPITINVHPVQPERPPLDPTSPRQAPRLTGTMVASAVAAVIVFGAVVLGVLLTGTDRVEPPDTVAAQASVATEAPEVEAPPAAPLPVAPTAPPPKAPATKPVAPTAAKAPKATAAEARKTTAAEAPRPTATRTAPASRSEPVRSAPKPATRRPAPPTAHGYKGLPDYL